jgi:chaperonin GroES
LKQAESNLISLFASTLAWLRPTAGVTHLAVRAQPDSFFGDLFSLRRWKMKIRPLYDRVIVKRIKQQRTTASGIVIPDSAAEKPEQGEVIAVGDGRLLQDGTRRPLQLNVGDQVLFGKYAGQTVKVDGEELLVMREEDVMGVLESDAAAARKAA